MLKELTFISNLIQIIEVSCSCVSCEVKSGTKCDTTVTQFQISPPQKATETRSELQSDTDGAVCSNDE
jgi:hypothetical protein